RVSARRMRKRHAIDSGEQASQPRYVTGQRTARRMRRPIRPQPNNQLLHRNAAVHIDEQRGQHTPLAGLVNLEPPPVDSSFDVAEYPELDRHRSTPFPPHPANDLWAREGARQVNRTEEAGGWISSDGRALSTSASPASTAP